MFLFKKRPLAFICTLVLLFLFIAPHIGSIGRLVSAAVFSLGVLVCTLAAAGINVKIPYPRLFGKYSALVFLFLFLFLLAAAVIGVAYYDGAVGNAHAYRREDARITAYAEGDASSGGRTVVITSVDGESVFLRALLIGDGAESLTPYGVFSASDARIIDLGAAGSVGTYGTYYQSKGIFLSVEADEINPLPDEAYPPSRFFYRINTFARERIYRFVPDNAGFISAIVLGNRNDADAILKSDFRKIGASHLLALSGMHFTALLFGMEFALGKLRFRRSVKYAVMLVPALLYIGVAGFSLSLVRAGLMYLIYRISYFCGRRGDGVTSLLFAAAVIALILPTSVYDVGFLLSVSSVLAILLFAQPAVRQAKAWTASLPMPKFFRWLLDKAISVVLISLAVLLFVIPVSAVLIGTFSTVSVIATLLLSLFILLILYAAPLLLLFCGVPPVAAAIGFLIDRDADIVVRLSHKLAARNYTVSLTAGYVKYILILFIILILVSAHLKKRRRFCCVLSFVLCAAIFMGAFMISRAGTAEKSELVIFSDRRGDIVLCISENRVLLCDETRGSTSLYDEAISYLRARNITKIDTLLFTHFHEGHPYLLKNLYQRIHIEEAILPEDYGHPETEALKTLCMELGVPFSCYDRKVGAERVFGAVSVSLMGTGNVLYRDPAKADITLPLRFQLGEACVVFAPDASADYMKDAFTAGDGIVYVYGNHVKEVLPDFSFSDTADAARAIYLPSYADEDYLAPYFADYLADRGVSVQYYGPVLTIPFSPARLDP